MIGAGASRPLRRGPRPAEAAVIARTIAAAQAARTGRSQDGGAMARGRWPGRWRRQHRATEDEAREGHRERERRRDVDGRRERGHRQEREPGERERARPAQAPSGEAVDHDERRQRHEPQQRGRRRARPEGAVVDDRQHQQDRPRDDRQAADQAADPRTEAPRGQRRADDERRREDQLEGEDGHGPGSMPDAAASARGRGRAQSSNSPSTRQKTAPWGSSATAKRPEGTAIGSTSMRPPSAAMRSSVASTSATPK